MYTCVCLSLSVCVFIKTISQSAYKYTITTILRAPPNRRNPSEFFDMPGLADNLPVWTMVDLVAKGNPKYEDNKKKSYYTAINSKVSFSAFPKLLGVRSLKHLHRRMCERIDSLTYFLICLPTSQVVQWLGPQGPGFPNWGLFTGKFFGKQLVFEFAKLEYDPK